jgi:hypothetical protein
MRLAQPGGPTARAFVLPFYLNTEEDPASETFFFNIDDGQSPKNRFYR